MHIDNPTPGATPNAIPEREVLKLLGREGDNQLALLAERRALREALSLAACGLRMALDYLEHTNHVTAMEVVQAGLAAAQAAAEVPARPSAQDPAGAATQEGKA